MKKSKIILMLGLLIGTYQLTAQTIVVGGSPLNLPCGGGTVNLTALGTSSVPVFGDNFNTGTVAPGWSSSPAAQFNNPCGASMDGTTYLWMGPATAAPRSMVTAPVNVACGGQVCFDFKFTCESCGDNSPCEGADLYNEGVSLQYSVSGVGGPWVDMAYFAPNGNLLGAYPGAVTAPVAAGATPFTTWQNYCFTIPVAAYSANTLFRTYQWGSSGTTFDHWGIDNFYVYATPCTPFYYDWAHIPGAPNPQNTTTTVTSTTTFTCCYTNGTLSACGNVTVNVATIPQPSINVTHETCAGLNNGAVLMNNPGGSGPYQIVITGPVNDTYTEGNGAPDNLNINNLPDGIYSYTVTSNSGCVVTGTFTVNPGPPCCSVTATSTPALCNGQATGTATANPVGAGPFNYSWSPGGQTTQTATNLAAGTYTVTTTDALGCVATANVTVGQPAAPLNATATVTQPLCFGNCNGTIVINAPTGGTGPYQYSKNGGPYQVSPTFGALCAGTYNMSVRDANNCTFPLTVIVGQPTDLTLVQTAISPATCGGTNGSVTVVASGGTSGTGFPSYSITGPSPLTNTTGIFPGRAAGAYTVTVTDANGCTETLPVTIGSLPGPVAVVDVQTNVACAGALTGSVTIGVTGGTGTIQYGLDGPPSQTSNTFTNVSAGSHTVNVQDANGCPSSVTFTITQPTPLAVTTVVTSPTCNGLCDGQIQVNASGGTGPYTYSSNGGLTFQTSNILTGLCAGVIINVVTKDANGCLLNTNITLTQPPVLTSTYGHVDPECHQTPTGEISFVPAGGTPGPGYTFSIDGGVTFSTTNPFINLMAGDYDVVVKDNNGCEVTSIVTLTDPPAFGFNFIANNPSNCGFNDGSFEIEALNGLGPYTYSINGIGGSTTQVGVGFYGGLFSGLYNLVVFDANGCVDSVYSALSDNIMIPVPIDSVNTTCYNGCDGLYIVSQSAGAFPFTYELTPGGDINFSGIFGGLCAGTYYVTIQDAGACIAIQQFSIEEPDTITMTLASIDVTCNGGSDGQINVSGATGGANTTYTYSIDGITFQAGTNFAGLNAGTYTIYARDVNGCLGAETIEVVEPDSFVVIINTSDVTCNGFADGFAQLVVSGSNPGAYDYTFGADNNTTGIFPGLTASPVGVPYNVIVEDVLGCQYTTTQVITQPTALTATYVVTDAQCNGVCDGEVEVTASGGTPGPGYLYSPNGGTTLQSSNTLLGLCDGNHNIYVVDDNGCEVIAVQTVNEPTLITMAFVIDPATCGLNNGVVTINAANGTGPYNFSVDNGVTFQGVGLNVFTNLAPDNYPVVTEDANGCQISGIAIVGNDALPVIDNIVAVDPLCNADNNGSITVTSSSGVGTHEYSIDGTNFQLSNVFNTLIAGNYIITVRDANLCIATVNVTLTDPPVLGYNAVITDLLCNGDFSGQLVLSGTGGTTPYLYSIDAGGTFSGGGTFSSIAANAYNIIVEDDNGCQVIAVETVNQPGTLVFNSLVITDPTCFAVCDGVVNTVVGGGTGPFTYNWSGGIAGSTSPDATAVCAGTYSLIVTDDNGCSIDSIDFVLTDPAQVPLTGVVTTDVLCYDGSTGTITINAPTATQFSIDGGLNYQGSNVFNGLPAGTYDVAAQDPDGCISLSTTQVLEPDSLYSIAPSDWFGCFGADVVVQAFNNGGVPPYTYLWTNNIDATTQTTDMFNYTILLPAPGIDFTLVITDDNGCVAAPVTYNVSSSPPLTAVAGNDTTICLDGTATLNVFAAGGTLIDFGAYQGYSYSWNTGVPVDTLASVTVSPATQTLYVVTVTDLCGQSVQDSMIVNLYIDPIPTVVGGGNGCVPELMSFSNPDYLSGSCLWNFGDGTTSTDCGATDHLYTQTGCFDVTLTLTSTDGCSEGTTYDDLVCISALPVPGFYWSPHNPTILDPTIQIINMAENTAFYEYNFGGLGVSLEEEPSFTFPSTQQEATYEVCQYVTSADGCKDTVCREILVQEEIIFYVPNVFTPDGDPNNQMFKPVVTSGVDMFNYHLTIFNRWGEVIFESFNYDFGWDGTFGDQGLVADGVYIWQIEFGEKYTGKVQTHRGHVTVLK